MGRKSLGGVANRLRTIALCPDMPGSAWNCSELPAELRIFFEQLRVPTQYTRSRSTPPAKCRGNPRHVDASAAFVMFSVCNVFGIASCRSELLMLILCTTCRNAPAEAGAQHWPTHAVPSSAAWTAPQTRGPASAQAARKLRVFKPGEIATRACTACADQEKTPTTSSRTP